ncbi:MAG: heme exporter protein CcmD [Alphaproteobacteria bacterium]|nr:heme exporter protein CcmD [Alphaproteobacteria bacterium]MBV8548500.1 heme exporter protein CcmD [Alphaproteobacteria bacterium]
MNWLSNPHADYVLAAYAIAALALTGLWLTIRIGLSRLRRRDPAQKQ